MQNPVEYKDHIGLWSGELSEWLPDEIFDGHVHLGRAEDMGTISAERQQATLAAFEGFTIEQAQASYEKLYIGKKMAGINAFAFPFFEVDIEAANSYIVEVMKANPLVKGCVLSDPVDTDRTIRNFEMSTKAGVRFSGVKPYYDLLGKSNYETHMNEFIPQSLLEFMNAEHLVMILHTSGIGMSVPENQDFVKAIADKYPAINVVLAHMGRFLQPDQFYEFLESDVLDADSVYLGTSFMAIADLYRSVLERKKLRDRLLFGTDFPYGILMRREHVLEDGEMVTITRQDHVWANAEVNQRFSDLRSTVTHNTYHVIKAIKDAVTSLGLSGQQEEDLKKKIFAENALKLYE